MPHVWRLASLAFAEVYGERAGPGPDRLFTDRRTKKEVLPRSCRLPGPALCRSDFAWP